jgi:hypothetical protein
LVGDLYVAAATAATAAAALARAALTKTPPFGTDAALVGAVHVDAPSFGAAAAAAAAETSPSRISIAAALSVRLFGGLEVLVSSTPLLAKELVELREVRRRDRWRGVMAGCVFGHDATISSDIVAFCCVFTLLAASPGEAQFNQMNVRGKSA